MYHQIPSCGILYVVSIELVTQTYFLFYFFKKHISCKYVVIFKVWWNMKAVQHTQIVHYAKRRFSFFHSLMQECYYGVYFTSYWYYLHHSSYRCPFYALDPIDVLLYSRVTESFWKLSLHNMFMQIQFYNNLDILTNI